MDTTITMNGLTYCLEDTRPITDSRHKDMWEYLKHDLQHQLQNAQMLYDEVKERGLSTSMVEAEGFLRAMHAVNDIIEENEVMYNYD